MRKVLLLTTVSGFVPQFEMGNVRILQQLGYEVHYAANFNMPVYGHDNSRLNNTNIQCHHVNINKSPYKLITNMKAYKKIVDIIKSEKIDLIHCHTPVGGALGRLAAKACNVDVIYTAHGFHFYKGGPWINWLIYYPIERILAGFTNILITINEEDYKRAKDFRKCKVAKISGVGLQSKEFLDQKINRAEKCTQLGIDESKFILSTIGEINKNKNHQVVLRAISELKDNNIVYLICGNGNNLKNLKELAVKLDIVDQVKFLGYRNDVKEILSISDCFLFPSKREGLGMAALEAMASGLPLLAADSRGTKEYTIHSKTGFVYQANDYKGFAKGIKLLQNNANLREKMSGFNRKAVLKFDIENITPQMEKIYRSI
jgi:glycosyltransferase involved in cell wall biosynthesis